MLNNVPRINHCSSFRASLLFNIPVLIPCLLYIISFLVRSFNKLLLQKEELEQKHLHLLQIVESEKTAKWQYTQQCEELASEIKKLRAEVRSDTTVPLPWYKEDTWF
jgi:predicted PurR-regulated permease PerM